MQQQNVPLVNLRIPGQWQDLDAFLDQLPDYCHWDNPWLRVDDLDPVMLDWRPADNEFAHVFKISCRRPPLLDEMERVQQYTYNACIQGKGGSNLAAQALVRTAAALIGSGGAGVFIDNGAISHGAIDWLDLAKHYHEPLAIFYAFINITRSATGYSSYGMHVLGQQDGFIQCHPQTKDADADAALRAIEDFLRQAAREQRVWSADEEFCDEQGQRYLLRPHPHASWMHDQNPMWNPYGRWELVTACGIT